MKLRAAGRSLGDIASKLKLTKTTVYRMMRAAKMPEK
jgi:DNA-binding IclR family transcriptional regulator